METSCEVLAKAIDSVPLPRYDRTIAFTLGRRGILLVEIGSLLGMLFTLVVAFFLPCIVTVVLCGAKALRWRSVIVGFLVYGLAQTCLRLPALWLLYRIPAVAEWSHSLLGYGLVMGVTAALFEEGGRLLGGKFGLGKKRLPTARDALGYSLGHGLAETFFLLGMSTFSNLMLAFSINNTGLAGYGELFGYEQAQQVYDVLTTTSPWAFAAGGLERMLYLAIQVALTLLVFYGLRQRRWKYCALAAGVHLALTGGVALLQPHGMLVAEIYIALVAVFLAAITWPVLQKFIGLDRQQMEEENPLLPVERQASSQE